MRLALSNSGGKDSYLALKRAQEAGFKPVLSMTMLHETLPISRSHALPTPLLTMQAEGYGLPTLFYRSSWELYEQNFLAMLREAKEYFGIEGVIFGDRCFQSNQDWGLSMCAKAGLEAFHPIWNVDPHILWQEAQAKSIQAFICSCKPTLKDILGNFLSPATIDYLEQQGADIFGENGEFHTFVTNGIAIENYVKEQVQIEDYCFVTYQLGYESSL